MIALIMSSLALVAFALVIVNDTTKEDPHDPR